MTEYLRYTESGGREYVPEDDIFFWSSHFNEQVRRRMNIGGIPQELGKAFLRIDDIISFYDYRLKIDNIIKDLIH